MKKHEGGGGCLRLYACNVPCVLPGVWGKEEQMQERMESAAEGLAGRSIQAESVHILQTQLEEYAARGLYPFHMPGHKRRFTPAPGLPACWDLTEVPGTDDLHNASGILREAMDRTASLCGSARTWYLVNGSTCGLLAGIRALAGRGSSVLCARNCHKAVYHALELAGCRVHWILPPIAEGWGICGGITAAQVSAAIRRHPSVRAVILTSPTYEGVLSEIEEICNVCHAKSIPVLIDEAHGAHLLPVSREAGFPAGALSCGADVVVQSPHKTLPSMTQTALLHMQGDLVDPDRIERQLDIFETSSPSYPLLASLDGCTGILREQGRELFALWAARIGRFDTQVRNLQRIRILYHTRAQAEEKQELPSVQPDLYDPGKILIDASRAGMTGPELAFVLRERWKMETEMAQGNLVLAMTSLCDDEDALDRLAAALREIDVSVGEYPSKEKAGNPDEEGVSCFGIRLALAAIHPVTVCSLWDACQQETEKVPAAEAAGRVSAESLYFYPPGIPFLAPGELITPRILRLLADARRSGEQIYRGRDEYMLCLRE